MNETKFFKSINQEPITEGEIGDRFLGQFRSWATAHKNDDYYRDRTDDYILTGLCEDSEVRRFLRDGLCRCNLLKCTDCGGLTEMYYAPYCFHCTKPEGRDVRLVNYIMARNWMRLHEPSFNEESVWNAFCKNPRFGNDSNLHLDQIHGNDEWDAQRKLLEQHFGEDCIWEISW